jgi:protein involved in plasmid replication-relaxation
LKEIVRPRRFTAHDVVRLASHLTERDRQIALDCFDHHVLTTSQIKRLHFTDTRTTVARLNVLYRLRVLDRFRPALPRGRGTAPYHWILDEVARSSSLRRRTWSAPSSAGSTRSP